jgi:hypothetical protein
VKSEDIKTQIISLLEEKHSLEEQLELGCAVEDDIKDCNAALKGLLKEIKKAEFAEGNAVENPHYFSQAQESFTRSALPISSPAEYDELGEESFP